MYLLAAGPRMVELAGEVADGAFLMVGLHPASVAAARRHLEAGARRAGRSLDGFHTVFIVTIALEEPNDFMSEAIEGARAEIATALRDWFDGVMRVQLRRVVERGTAPPPKRLTDEMVRRERLSALRKRDPVLGAAIDALDLDVVD